MRVQLIEYTILVHIKDVELAQTWSEVNISQVKVSNLEAQLAALQGQLLESERLQPELEWQNNEIL